MQVCATPIACSSRLSLSFMTNVTRFRPTKHLSVVALSLSRELEHEGSNTLTCIILIY